MNANADNSYTKDHYKQMTIKTKDNKDRKDDKHDKNNKTVDENINKKKFACRVMNRQFEVLQIHYTNCLFLTREFCQTSNCLINKLRHKT